MPTNTFGKSIFESGGSIVPTLPVPGEPAVISSVSGEQKFQQNVQPKIDAANDTVKKAQEAAKNAVAMAFGAKQNTPDPLPADVAAEIESNKTPEQKIYEARIANYDKQQQEARDTFDKLVISQKEANKATIAALTSTWQSRRALLEQSNKANEASWNQQFIRSGQAEYSPGMTSDLITAKEQEGMRKVAELDEAYTSKVAEINAALENKQFEAAAKLTADLNTIEQNALTLMQANAKEAREVNDKIQERVTRASRDNAIAGLVAQGITDATEIMALLNESAVASGFDGSDFTAEEIDKALKIFNPSNDLAGLDSDFRTFKYLQENQPDEVKGLSYLDYVAAVGNAKRKATGGGTGEAFKFSSTQLSQLLAGGFSQGEINQMQSDIAQFGLGAVTEGLPETQQKLIRRVLAGSDSVAAGAAGEGTLLTREKLAQIYGIEDNNNYTDQDSNGWWPGGKQTGKETLDALVALVERYKEFYSDKEILKMLEDQSD